MSAKKLRYQAMPDQPDSHTRDSNAEAGGPGRDGGDVGAGAECSSR